MEQEYESNVEKVISEMFIEAGYFVSQHMPYRDEKVGKLIYEADTVCLLHNKNTKRGIHSAILGNLGLQKTIGAI